MTSHLDRSAIALLFVLFSSPAISEARNCSGAHLDLLKFGQLGEIEYGQVVTPVEVSKRALQERAHDMLDLSKNDPLPGEEMAYVSASLGYLGGAEGPSYSCLLEFWQDGDKLLPFEEFGDDSKRTGYVLIRDGIAIAYLYESVVNV
ncbi:hypothetical protein BST95_07725 [Halioglobus japonicus]|uniref:Uncharacterized protein n=1 Tax=Halioglobus japonicus TaxID=930805 RepID=A0AAP8ME35_9GAMM|nr:hypothetical protein [Halioglobus japonicus]AQA18145.1 hypothetical protein BST95_07725 [Halioglobus japonicus]PLW86141.1 hypothetical protein C0029_06765 [Halioglobus japonicus]